MRNNFSIEIDFKDKEKNKIVANNTFYKENINIVLLGELYNKKSEKMELEEIYSLYLEFEEKIYNNLDGTYTLVIIDYNKNKLLIFQDYFRI